MTAYTWGLMSGSRSRRRIRTARLAVLLVAALLGCLLAPVPASAAGTGGISGVVTGPGGPLQGVEVLFHPGDNSIYGAITDATGTYAIANLPARDYKVLVGWSSTDSPFVEEWYDDAPDNASAEVLHVADGATITGINAELAVGAKVSGRLTTSGGVGVANGTAAPYRLVEGVYEPYNRYGITDADGFYVVQGLPPGTYRLSFSAPERGDLEYWNDKPNLAEADDIVLTAGQVRTGIDAVVPPPPPPAPAPPLPAIVNAQLPIVSGAPVAPQVGYPLTVSQGVWTPDAAAMTVQWLVNGQPIPGATGTSYTPTFANLGRTLAVRATASLPGYASATVTTLPTNAVSKQVQNSVRPRLKGTPKVGERLRVKPGLWRPLGAVTFRYRWYADGQRVGGARDDRLRLTSAMTGKKIVCRVTGSAPGLDPLKVKTRASAKVKK